jgi:hypothetical protein
MESMKIVNESVTIGGLVFKPLWESSVIKDVVQGSGRNTLDSYYIGEHFDDSYILKVSIVEINSEAYLFKETFSSGFVKSPEKGISLSLDVSWEAAVWKLDTTGAEKVTLEQLSTSLEELPETHEYNVMWGSVEIAEPYSHVVSHDLTNIERVFKTQEDFDKYIMSETAKEDFTVLTNDFSTIDLDSLWFGRLVSKSYWYQG